MPPVGFKPTISAGERPQTYAIDPAVTGTGTAQSNRKLGPPSGPIPQLKKRRGTLLFKNQHTRN